MIQERPTLPACPYCGAMLPFWPRAAPVHGCQTCLRPLVIVPGNIRRPRYHRIHALFDIAKYLTALAAVLVLAALAIGKSTPSALVAVTIMVFFVHGSMDLFDGLLGIKTGIDRTWNRRTGPRATQIYAALKIVFGAALLVGCAAGAAIWL